MGWFELAGFGATILLLLFLPGALVSHGARLSWTTSFAIAPAISTAIIATAAIVSHLLHIKWGLFPVLFLAAICLGICFAISKIYFYRSTQNKLVPTPGLLLSNEHQIWPWLIAFFSGAGIIIWHFTSILGRSNSFSQTFDNTFHLNAIRWILNNHNGSSLAMSMNSVSTSTSFYPLAWHDVVSLALLVTHSQNVPVANNAMIMVVSAVIWTTGSLFLIHTIWRKISLPAILAAGFATAAFPTFPYLPAYYGVLYPNLFGYALLPTSIAFAYRVLGPAAQRLPIASALPPLFFIFLGMSLAHPNTVALFCVALISLIISWVLSSLKSEEESFKKFPIILLSLSIIGTVGIWKFLRPPASASAWSGIVGPRAALWEGLTITPSLSEKVSNFSVLPISIFTLTGLFFCLVKKKQMWLIITHSLLIFLWVIASGFRTSSFRSSLVGIWYNDSARLAAALPLTAFPLALIGISSATQTITGLCQRHASNKKLPALFIPSITIITVLILGLITLFSSQIRQAISDAAETYSVTPTSNLVNSDEYALIRELPHLIAPQATVITFSASGGSMAFALENVRTTTTQVFYPQTQAQETIVQNLRNAATDPQVCSAIHELGASYVFDTDSHQVNDAGLKNPGFDDLKNAPGFTPLASHGQAVLYRIDACS